MFEQAPKRPDKLPTYEQDFGHMAESILRESIGTSHDTFIEEIEQASPSEDIRNKVDFWIKLVGIEKPIGVQYTISDNEDRIAQKESILRSMHYTTEKEARPDAVIPWSGEAPLVLVQGDKKLMAEYWKRSQELKVSPAKVVGSDFFKNFYSQVFWGLEKADPEMKQILLEAVQRAIEKKKSRGKISPTH